ncbi:glycosyl transferase family 2 [Brevundimonas sp. S30B]|uniref:glycosyltransferase family 2 protein n=1 Tax=unclassified Brevundimonas TaxID=2622653 RepID=UPI001072226B|nr:MULTISPECIES: glycosyltransferase family 2 protein [unclassified Brevundimonas]QBX38792.1 glycosyl transferase family 2 [Brevundimonas sp. MF30-B]TFW01384.1 glycosyl transferase family 2 [Brevundimonas sp. S30B]
MTTTIVIPMAGRGSRFADAGYTTPKPLIPIHGRPMIQVVIDNIRPSTPHRFVFICQAEAVGEYGLRDQLQEWAPGSALVELNGVTEGAACTVLEADAHIDRDQPLMIANSDQYVDIAIDDYLAEMDRRDLDGLIMTMDADDPKWSFAALDDQDLVTRVVEKQPISRHATVGIYNYRRGGDFIDGAREMIARDLRVNGEFYVAPVYDQMIARGARVGVFGVGAEADGMYGLGIPADLDRFAALEVSRRAVEGLD